jgi:hypothetical protein
MHGEDKSYRAFVVAGSETQRSAAKHIISSAVDLYQQLFTGALGAWLICQGSLQKVCWMSTVVDLEITCGCNIRKFVGWYFTETSS